MGSYTIVITGEPEGGGYNVVVPALDGCFTSGDTLAEAIASAHEAVELFVETLIDQGLDVPDGVKAVTTTVQIDVPAPAAP